MKLETITLSKFSLEIFRATKIIFDDSDLVSMDIQCKIQSDWMETTLLFTFKQFNDLLRFGGFYGEKLALRISDKLISNEEKPYCIDLNHESYIFSTCKLDVQFLITTQTTCFTIEKITAIPYLQQVKNLRNNISNFKQVSLNPKDTVKNTVYELANMYQYYQGLIELNVKDETARKMSGLSNEYLFKLSDQAYHHK